MMIDLIMQINSPQNCDLEPVKFQIMQSQLILAVFIKERE